MFWLSFTLGRSQVHLLRKEMVESELAWREKLLAMEKKYKSSQERRQRETHEYEQHIAWYKQETESLLTQMQQILATKDSLEKEVEGNTSQLVAMMALVQRHQQAVHATQLRSDASAAQHDALARRADKWEAEARRLSALRDQEREASERHVGR